MSLLYLVGYPVASSGVTIQIGQYQLLVAAACAGLNSIVTLTALCLFYVYLRHRSNPIAFLVISLAAIPVAVVSNFVRVVVLVLVTYYFGDSAAQGFLHDFAGLLMFSVALLTIFGVDQLAAPLFVERAGRHGMKPIFDSFTEPKTDRRKFLIGLLFCSAAGVAALRKPETHLDYLGEKARGTRPEDDRQVEVRCCQRAGRSTRRPAPTSYLQPATDARLF